MFVARLDSSRPTRGIAQLVEHQLPKLRVAGSSPVSRSAAACAARSPQRAVELVTPARARRERWRLAQLVRASDLHSEGPGFESLTAHLRQRTMRHRSIWRSPKVSGTCPVCGETVEGTVAKPRKFCSVVCSNKGRTRTSKRVRGTCRTCEAALTNPESTYCSAHCHREFRYLHETKPRIERGDCSVNSTLKSYLGRERGPVLRSL